MAEQCPLLSQVTLTDPGRILMVNGHVWLKKNKYLPCKYQFMELQDTRMKYCSSLLQTNILSHGQYISLCFSAITNISLPNFCRFHKKIKGITVSQSCGTSVSSRTYVSERHSVHGRRVFCPFMCSSYPWKGLTAPPSVKTKPLQ